MLELGPKRKQLALVQPLLSFIMELLLVIDLVVIAFTFQVTFELGPLTSSKDSMAIQSHTWVHLS